MRKGHDRMIKVEPNVFRRGRNYYVRFKFKRKSIWQSIGPKRGSAAKVIAKIKTEIAENRFLDVRRAVEPITFHQFGVRFSEWAETNQKPKTFIFTVDRMRQLDKFFGEKLLSDISPMMIEKYKSLRKNQAKFNEPTIGVTKTKKTRKNPVEKDDWYVQYTRDGHLIKRYFKGHKEEAEKYLEHCMGRKIAPGTVNRDLAVLHHMLSKAKAWGVIHESPFSREKGVKKLKGESKRMRYLMPDQVQRLIDYCEPEYLRDIVTVAVHSGMRWGEIRSLRRDYINWQVGMISLPDSKNNDRRDIPIDPTVTDILRNIKDNGSPYLFSNGNGGSIGSVRNSFKTALRRSGIEDFRFHDLRHTFASNLVMAGESIKTVQELLGHKDIKMTMRYAHLAPDYKRKAILNLDKVLTEKPKERVVPLRAGEAHERI